MVAARDGSRELELPRGLRMRVLYRTATGQGYAFDGFIRRAEGGSITVGLLDLPLGGSALRGKTVSLVARLHGRTYSMSSTVLAIEDRPPGLIVTVPTDARLTEQRVFYRLNVSIDARAAWFDPRLPSVLNHLESVRLLDISGGGALVRSRERVPTGSGLRLEFLLEGDSTPLRVNGYALRVELEGREQAYLINTKFEGLSHRIQEQIVRFIYRQQSLLSRRRSQ